jgi:hypothetical protein
VLLRADDAHLREVPSARVDAALVELGKPGGLLDANDPLAAGPEQLIVDLSLSANNTNNPSQTAGMTFLGQFLDHDLTFDASSRLAQPTNPEEAGNFPHACVCCRRSASARRRSQQNMLICRAN